MLSYDPIITNIVYRDVNLSVLRLDLIHPEISGNKWFKLKYNLEQAISENKECIITFGGAHSNHIAATAHACKLASLKSIGIIRGEDSSMSSRTLIQAQKDGMELQFVSRELYKQKDEKEYLENLSKSYPNSFIIPEGGNNVFGEKGCQEIITDDMNSYSSIFCAYGTGATFRGLQKAIGNNQKLIGINVLKYDAPSESEQFRIMNDYHFGGYAKHTNELIEFKKEFEKKYTVKLDYVYTSKLFFAVFDLIDQQKIEKDQSVLVIHSGGLQGNAAYEERYGLG